MGYTGYSSTDWKSYSSSAKTKTTDAIFTKRAMDNYLDPKNITIRESRDSDTNPLSTPVILALDVTGSMGVIADQIAKNGLGVTFEGLIDRKPITDPHVLVMGIGDVRYDRAPVQATQFESGVPELTTQIEKVYLEHGGGGNATESYDAAWWFAAQRTSTDSWEKRNKKGYLFTIGDEEPPQSLPQDLMEGKAGAKLQADLSSEDALEMAERQWNVFHIIVEEGSHCRSYGADSVARKWAKILGQRVIRLSDISKLGEVIVSAIEVAEGRDKDSVADSWGAGTDLVVRNAVRDLAVGNSGSRAGLVTL
jgi:hypothetical protein